MRHFDVAERRRRLVARHRLDRGGHTVEQVAGELVGLHSTDPATVYLSLWARLPGFERADLESALYDERTLVRLLGMRRTMFVVPHDLAGSVDAACSRALVASERKRVAVAAEAQGITTDGERWIDEAYESVLAVLRGRPPMPARDVTPLVPHVQMSMMWGAGSAHAASVGAASRVLFLLGVEGHIVRARPLGSWVSSQYRWAPFGEWFGIAERGHPWRSGHAGPGDEKAARADLVKRWLRTYGPGTLEDIAWWGKWTKGQARAALASVEAVEVTVEPAPGAVPLPGWVLPDDLDDTPAGAMNVSLIPGLDQAIMGWKQRDWILGEHGAALFDRTGNAGPMVLVDGGAVGAWSQVEGGRVVWESLTPVAKPVRAAVDRAAAELTAWMDGVRITPRFANPLERRLAAGG